MELVDRTVALRLASLPPTASETQKEEARDKASLEAMALYQKGKQVIQFLDADEQIRGRLLDFMKAQDKAIDSLQSKINAMINANTSDAKDQAHLSFIKDQLSLLEVATSKSCELIDAFHLKFEDTKDKDKYDYWSRKRKKGTCCSCLVGCVNFQCVCFKSKKKCGSHCDCVACQNTGTRSEGEPAPPPPPPCPPRPPPPAEEEGKEEKEAPPTGQYKLHTTTTTTTTTLLLLHTESKICRCNFCQGKAIGTEDFPWTCCIRDVEEDDKEEEEEEESKCMYCEEKPNEPEHFDCVGLGACYSCLDCRKSRFLHCANCGLFMMKGDKIIDDPAGYCKHNWSRKIKKGTCCSCLVGCVNFQCVCFKSKKKCGSHCDCVACQNTGILSEDEPLPPHPPPPN
jgi:hypothetical protein